MGLQFTLRKENNFVYMDIPDAYWAIEDIGIGTENGRTLLRFAFRAYASLEAKRKKGMPVQYEDIAWGASYIEIYSPVLYEWIAEFPVADVFPSGIPITEAGQKDVLYPFLKQYLQLSDALDVLDE